MDLDLDSIEPQVAIAKKPTFKKKRILAEGKRIKRQDKHEEAGNVTSKEEAAQSEIHAATPEPQASAGTSLKGVRVGGFRNLKKTRNFQSVSQNDIIISVTDDLEDANLISHIHRDDDGDDMVDANDPIETSRKQVGSPIDPFNFNTVPSADIYDLDLPVDDDANENDEYNPDGSVSASAIRKATLQIKPLESHIEFLQDHIFVLKDEKQTLGEKIKQLNEKKVDLQARKEKLVQEFSQA